MTPVRRTASVSPGTVTRLSRGEVGARSSAGYGKGKSRILAVKDGWAVRIDPRIMSWLHENKVDFRCVEVVSATEVIVHNNRIR